MTTCRRTTRLHTCTRATGCQHPDSFCVLGKEIAESCRPRYCLCANVTRERKTEIIADVSCSLLLLAVNVEVYKEGEKAEADRRGFFGVRGQVEIGVHRRRFFLSALEPQYKHRVDEVVSRED